MILSDREINAEIQANRINLTAVPLYRSRRWSSSTLDLPLDAEIRPWYDLEGAGTEVNINPATDAFDSNALVAQYTQPVDCTEGFVLNPRQLVLGWTVERLRLRHTSRLGARVEGKSSLARIGLGVHVTAPTIHLGFGAHPEGGEGSSIRLEIWNAGPLRFRLTKGMAICQLIFEQVHGTPEMG